MTDKTIFTSIIKDIYIYLHWNKGNNMKKMKSKSDFQYI